VCGHRFRRVKRLHRLHRLGDPAVHFAHDFTSYPPFGRRRRRQPSFLTLLLAGLAVFAFVKLLSAVDERERSTAEKVLLVALLVAVGAIILYFRRSRHRYSW
jgi:hypothetical protein